MPLSYHVNFLLKKLLSDFREIMLPTLEYKNFTNFVTFF